MKERKKEIQRRCTAATRQRCSNILKLVRHMRETGPMLRDDIFDFLEMSPSGGRKYLRNLKEIQILVLDRFIDPTPTYLGHPLYRLSDDAKLIDQYLYQIVEEMAPAQKRAVKAPVVRDPARRVHTMGNDGELPRAAKLFRLPAPDPLLAQFFGFAGVTA